MEEVRSDMYGFILNMWIMGKVDERFVEAQVKFKRITEEEKEMILSTPKY